MPTGGGSTEKPSRSFPLVCRKAPKHHIERLHLVCTEAFVSIGRIDPQLPILFAGSAALVRNIVDLGEKCRRTAAGGVEGYSMRARLRRGHHVEHRGALRPGQVGDGLDDSIAVIDDQANGRGLSGRAEARRSECEQDQHNCRGAPGDPMALDHRRMLLLLHFTSAHSPMMPASASSPPVSAAGPACKMSGDLISRRKPSRTAGMAAKPGRAATLAGTNFLPHQEPTMMSGAAAISSAGDTMRSLAFLRRDSSGNASMPPATSINSATQRMPEIIGSSHSSK